VIVPSPGMGETPGSRRPGVPRTPDLRKQLEWPMIGPGRSSQNLAIRVAQQAAVSTSVQWDTG